jgi:hypothetical protein
VNNAQKTSNAISNPIAGIRMPRQSGKTEPHACRCINSLMVLLLVGFPRTTMQIPKKMTLSQMESIVPQEWLSIVI